MWTPQEDKLIIALRDADGPQWSKMTKHFPGRSASSIRNRFQRLEQVRKLREQQAARRPTLTHQASSSSSAISWLEQLAAVPGLHAENIKMSRRNDSFASASLNGLLRAKLEEASASGGAPAGAAPPPFAGMRTRTKSSRDELDGQVVAIADVVTEALRPITPARMRSEGSSSRPAGIGWTESEVFDALQDDPSVAALLNGVLDGPAGEALAGDADEVAARPASSKRSRSPGRSSSRSPAFSRPPSKLRKTPSQVSANAKAVNFLVKLKRQTNETRLLCDLLG